MLDRLKYWKIYYRYPELLQLPHRKVADDDHHLDLAISWIKQAAGSSVHGGVPTSFDLRTQTWGQPYRETTGYIIPTLLAYARLKNDRSALLLAIKLADWEIKHQDPGGGIGELKSDGSVNLKVFNTGQVILGWCAAYDATQDRKYLAAATTAAEWLLATQEAATGTWEKFSNNGANGIDSRVAWSLLELDQRLGHSAYQPAARKFLSWVASQQQVNGWFNRSSLRDPSRPWTHAIVYTISGLWESGELLKDHSMVNSSLKAAKALLEYYEHLPRFDHLPASFNHEWQSSDNYSCLPGNAQAAIEWQKMATRGCGSYFQKGAERMIDQLKSLQLTSTQDQRVCGGLTGSYPAFGAYATHSIPNWGVKFFADSLLLRLGAPPTLLG